MLAFGNEITEGLRLVGTASCGAGLRGASGMARELEED